MSNEPFPLTPDDLVGAVQRGLGQINAYLGRPALSVDTNEVLSALDRLGDMVRKIQDMQLSFAAANGNAADGASARKN